MIKINLDNNLLILSWLLFILSKGFTIDILDWIKLNKNISIKFITQTDAKEYFINE